MLAALLAGSCGLLRAGTVGEDAATEETPQPGFVLFRSGTRILGRVVSMTRGRLKLETSSAGEIQAEWYLVSSVKSSEPLTLILEDGRRLRGEVRPAREGRVEVLIDGGPEVVFLRGIVAINPPPEQFTFNGEVSFGGSVTDGNTQSRTALLLADFEARSEQQRVSLGASWNYAEDEDGLSARHTKGSAKYDFFLTHRLYAYAAAVVEENRFQDLNLRTVFSAGPGYQFVNKGDFENEWLNGYRWMNDLEFSGELGLSYFIEDLRSDADRDYLAARWSAKIDWTAWPNVTLFHRHEGFPSLEDREDIYVSSRQGVRFDITGNFFSTLQLKWDWDNKPAAGFERSDFQLLVTLGYDFDL